MFPCRAGRPTSRAEFQKSVPTEGHQLCHGFVSAGDALGRERPATPMSSFMPGVLGASDLILLYYWGGLHSAAPTGGGPCSAVLRHLRVANALVRI